MSVRQSASPSVRPSVRHSVIRSVLFHNILNPLENFHLTLVKCSSQWYEVQQCILRVKVSYRSWNVALNFVSAAYLRLGQMFMRRTHDSSTQTQFWFKVTVKGLNNQRYGGIDVLVILTSMLVCSYSVFRLIQLFGICLRYGQVTHSRITLSVPLRIKSQGWTRKCQFP